MTTMHSAQSDCSETLVSVIMPMLNARPFLQESIGSILSQSFRHFELLIVDNGSTDGSREYAQSFSDTRIRVLSEPQSGTAHAINTGIAASRADLLAMMDADDISVRDRLMIQFAFMHEHPDTVLLGTRFAFLIGMNLVSVAPPLVHHQQIRKALLQGNVAVCGASAMFRAAAAKTVGGNRLNGPAHDLDFFLRMSEVGIVNNLPATLYHYRQHNASSTALSTAIITEHKMFAIACAKARAAGSPEPAFAEFRREWSTRPRLVKLVDRAHEVSHRLYRSAIAQRANGKLFSAGLTIVCSSLLNPRQVIWRIKRQLSSVDNQTHLIKSWGDSG